jgi:hypothetical protein
MADIFNEQNRGRDVFTERSFLASLANNETIGVRLLDLLGEVPA